jgi:TonB family protein
MKIIICLTAIALVWFQPAVAESNTFESATILSKIQPSFAGYSEPENSDNLDTDSGLVNVSFMVNHDGQPYEVTVISSSHSKFEAAAVSAIEAASYSAASLNGKAVNSRLNHMVEFIYSPKAGSKGRNKGLPNRFSGMYEKFNTEIQRSSPSQNKSTKYLEKMANIPNQNFYSLSYLSLARYRYAEEFGTPQEQINALEELIEFDSRASKKHKMLKGELKQTVLTALLKTQLDSSHFAEVLKNYKLFSKDDEQIKNGFASAYTKIQSISNDANSVTQRVIKIPARGELHLPLLKQSFLLDQVDGDIESFKMRCDKRFAKLPYQADGQYDIPASWGDCDLQIDGTAGTTATLLQQ